MTTKIATARWIVTGVKADHTPDLIEYAGIAHEDGAVLAVGSAADIKAAYTCKLRPG